MKKIETILTLGIALTIIFISSNLSFFIWNNIAGYYLLTILASFFGGVIMAAVDITTSKLKMLDPIIFPITISNSLFLAAAKEALSSVKLVPKATVVNPMNRLLA